MKTNQTVASELEDIIDVFNRLQALQERQPPPLRSHLSDRQRDGPDRSCEPFRGPKHVTGPSGASQAILRFDYHSKGLKP